MTTPNTNKSLSEIFDIELTATDKELGELAIEAKCEDINSLEKQRTYVKNNIVQLLEKGSKALDEILKIAESTESEKDFKTAILMIKTLTDTNMTLLECEVVKSKDDFKDIDKAQVTNNTAVYVGSTSELAKFLKTPSNIIENK